MEYETVRPFYQAAHVGLRALDQRGGRRRFGHEADELWKQLRGDMHEADRFDLLLRDAAATAPLAFAPRDVFALPGLSREDPFGPEWCGPPRGLAGEMLRASLSVSDDPVAAFDAALSAWGVTPGALSEPLPRIAPATRIVAGGLAALRALAEHFAAHRASLDLTDQVVLVADRPVERHLFGLAAVFLGATNPPRVVEPAVSVEALDAVKLRRVDACVLSSDASDAVREGARRIAATLTG